MQDPGFWNRDIPEPQGLVLFPLRIEAQKVMEGLKPLGLRPTPNQPWVWEWRPGAAHWRGFVFGPGANLANQLRNLANRWRHPPHFTLLAGFAGGLSAEAKPGTVWWARHLVRIEPTRGELDLEPWNTSARPASLFHSEQALCQVAQKRQAFDSLGCEIVDMESWGFAHLCRELGWRHGILRAVSDGPGESLPREAAGWMKETGELAGGTLAWDLVRRPGLFLSLGRLARNAALAGKALARTLAEILQSDWTDRTMKPSRP